MRSTYDPEFTPANFKPLVEPIHEFIVPDGSKITLLMEHVQGINVKAACFSFSRDDQPSHLTGQGYSVRIFKEIERFLKMYVAKAKLDYVFFAGPEREGREHLYYNLMERIILPGTRYRYVADPWDDINRVHNHMLNFLDMVEGPNIKVFVLARI